MADAKPSRLLPEDNQPPKPPTAADAPTGGTVEAGSKPVQGWNRTAEYVPPPAPPKVVPAQRSALPLRHSPADPVSQADIDRCKAQYEKEDEQRREDTERRKEAWRWIGRPKKVCVDDKDANTLQVHY